MFTLFLLAILKIAFTKTANAVCHLFSMSLTKGIFSRKWAIGFIHILPKGGDNTDPSQNIIRY